MADQHPKRPLPQDHTVPSPKAPKLDSPSNSSKVEPSTTSTSGLYAANGASNHQLQQHQQHQQTLQQQKLHPTQTIPSHSQVNTAPSKSSSSTSTPTPVPIPTTTNTNTIDDDDQNQNQPFSKALKRGKIKRIDGKWILPTVTREQTSEARKFLKKQGVEEFLKLYLPDSPRGSDILYAVVILGFYSENFNDDIDDERNLMKIVKLLQKAMNKVYSMRTRLDDIHTVEHALEKISKAQKILVLTGAGISTSLGIPDFRSSKGIYSKVQHLGLTDPQEVFDLETFREDPTIFYSVANMILPPLDSYTPLHAFIKNLNDQGKLLRNYTQNIDNLESNVGIDQDKIIQCHGSFATATCQTCRWNIDGSKIFKYIRDMELPICPHCFKEREKKLSKNDDFYPRSYGVMKPDITFFGEDLPSKFHNSIKQDVLNCDLLICIGTSLKVAPVSEIVNMIPGDVPQILINKDLVEHSEFDVSLLGYCDQVATYLCDKLGWKLNHKDFNKILDSDLKLFPLDEDIGIYEIKDKFQIEKEQQTINKTTPPPTTTKTTTPPAQ
ncbi:NAD-dependent histone deacetylase SIR2 [Wickerhamomyces ciferrii]|uniref:NAD-dependent histone deacetylase SIR2 n=1 Tax=Wickerhamomyces ciferrii (strain ATCC 14091 / BCRC 22168 / CBS 111 / JCM 3599 / NBRC 0793 / NRRL Y-1031 F-60-10) TaxID=1206466 RepID=K0KVG1_WICCF|nr:NAD-dependent histone deacetylase SIR2 [Wickerhamomyces ciferrii]CCH45439.1 NAD-dependent histone deacetylase SIR2 [Wickerhamomyces ciferrii]